MPALGITTAKQAKTNLAVKSVLFIHAEPHDGSKLSTEFCSAEEEQFRVESVTDISIGIERLRIGGISAVILNLTLPESNAMAAFERVFQVARLVPILILSDADAEETGSEA